MKSSGHKQALDTLGRSLGTWWSCFILWNSRPKIQGRNLGNIQPQKNYKLITLITKRMKIWDGSLLTGSVCSVCVHPFLTNLSNAFTHFIILFSVVTTYFISLPKPSAWRAAPPSSNPFCFLVQFPKAPSALRDVKQGILQPKFPSHLLRPRHGLMAVGEWSGPKKNPFFTGWSVPIKPFLTGWGGPKKGLFYLDGMALKGPFLTGWSGPKNNLFWLDGVFL